MIPFIKICGVKHAAHVRAAAHAGASAIGLNFVRPSSRFVGGAHEAAGLMRSCALPGVRWVGVFVDPDFDELMALHAALGFDILQLHGNESPGFIEKVKARISAAKIWKAFRVAKRADLAPIADYKCDGILLDAKVRGTLGGTGQTFDWSILNDFERPAPLILSGGLNPGNVTEAVRAVQPDWVDVASGVESTPGEKSATLIEEFIRAARLNGN